MTKARSDGHRIDLDERKESATPSSNTPGEAAPLLSARAAYASNDVDASRSYHTASASRGPAGDDGETQRKKDSESHSTYGEHIKSIVYGGLDGIITTFATVTSVAGAQLSPVVIVVLGISHLVADGLSMGTGDAMSSQAEIDLNKSERRRERWEMENNLKGEVDEMIDLYVSKGVKRTDAETIIRTMSHYPKQVSAPSPHTAQLPTTRTTTTPYHPASPLLTNSPSPLLSLSTPCAYAVPRSHDGGGAGSASS